MPVLFVPAGGTSGLVVGASSGSRWVDWEKAQVHIKAGDRYRFFTIAGSSRVKAVTKPVLSEASGAAYNVQVKRAGEKGPELGLPVSARWNLAPRPVKALAQGNAALRKSVAGFLKLKGVPNAEVDIKRVRECDLDGDGARETLIEAHSPNRLKQMREGEESAPGQFSVVVLRQSNGTVTKVGGEIHSKPDNGFHQYYELAHVLDLNGDGAMEIVVQSSYYEGGGADVYGWRGAKVKQLLTASDGL